MISAHGVGLPSLVDLPPRLMLLRVDLHLLLKRLQRHARYFRRVRGCMLLNLSVFPTDDPSGICKERFKIGPGECSIFTVGELLDLRVEHSHPLPFFIPIFGPEDVLGGTRQYSRGHDKHVFQIELPGPPAVLS